MAGYLDEYDFEEVLTDAQYEEIGKLAFKYACKHPEVHKESRLQLYCQAISWAMLRFNAESSASITLKHTTM